VLAARQLADALGYPHGHPSYGGFSYSSALQVPHYAGARDDRDSGANLSATLFAIGALRLGGTPLQDPVLHGARGFVERCQNFAARPQDSDPRFDDGGFFFSPAIDDPNKAGSPGRDRSGRLRHRSYGSMTADGVRALLLLGAGVDSPRVRAAAAWLERHFDPESNPGAFPANAEVRRHSAYYYYTWSAAHALRALGKPTLQTERSPVHWPQALAHALLARQAPDGSFRNAYTELREDDPLVATPFAAAALAVARSVLSGQHRSHRRTP
jgi:squalene-hopene/tetraprenyl-beta-curcumene cyclase